MPGRWQEGGHYPPNQMRDSKRNAAVIIARDKGYQINDDGSVKSPSGKSLYPLVDDSGYLYFTVKDARETFRVYVHKLAAFQKFGGNIFEEDREVRHLNGNRTDNSKQNISYGSHSDNMRDIHPTIRMHMSMAAAAVQRKLSVKEVRELRKLREEGWKLIDLAKKYKLAKSTVSYIINRKTYDDV
jgi:hypothetical protein